MIIDIIQQLNTYSNFINPNQSEMGLNEAVIFFSNLSSLKTDKKVM